MLKRQKIICSILAIAFMPIGFADAPSSSTADSLDSAAVLQALNGINVELQTIANNQSQTQQSLQNYSDFELGTAYPSVPFPGWDTLSSRDSLSSLFSPPPISTGVGYLSLLTDQNSRPSEKYQEFIKRKVLLSAQSAPSTSDSETLAQLSRYESLMNQAGLQANGVQSQRLTNQLLVLNAKMSYLQYQEERRLESLLVAQLFVQSQQKPTQGV
jgi:hypothetical protein